MRVYVLDHDHQPVPIGIPGELYLGGVGLARGYWNNPVLTAKSFIPDPFARAGGERLYRTGDLARWLSNGVLEFLGRADHQVKIRGHRVELGEIEATIESHPSVSQAAVAVKHSSQNEIHLTAYVVAKNRAALIPEDIRQWLAERLPAPMIPARIVFLDHLPLNQSGKIDRHALASMQVESLAPRRPIVGRPLDPTEERIAAIWREILQIKDIAPQDSFFEIGGHSLNAIQMLSRLRDSFGIEVPLRELFDEPTLASLAVRANKLAAGPAAKRTPIIRRARPTRSTGEVLSESNVTPAAETPNLRATYFLHRAFPPKKSTAIKTCDLHYRVRSSS
jgi:acyl carrier protein